MADVAADRDDLAGAAQPLRRTVSSSARSSAADAMFAPVVNRFDVYDLVTASDTLSYMAAVKAHPAWLKWEAAARAEPWIVPEDEV